MSDSAPPSPEIQPKPPQPIRQSLAAARANLAPGAVIFCFALAICLGYYHVPVIHDALQQVAGLKTRFGLLYAIVATTLFAGMIPTVVQYLRDPRNPRTAPRVWWFFLVFWAIKGIEVDLLYRGQDWVFGNAVNWRTIVPKVLVDQFVYVPFWAVPTMVLGYLWKDSGFSVSRTLASLGPQWYRRRMLPVMVSNWGVWIPAVAVIYALPLPLQLPIQNLVVCLWVLLLMYLVHDRDHHHDAEPESAAAAPSADDAEPLAGPPPAPADAESPVEPRGPEHGTSAT